MQDVLGAYQSDQDTQFINICTDEDEETFHKTKPRKYQRPKRTEKAE